MASFVRRGGEQGRQGGRSGRSGGEQGRQGGRSGRDQGRGRDGGGGRQHEQRGRGGGRGSGNKSMSDLQEIKNLLTRPEMSDRFVISTLKSTKSSEGEMNPRMPPNANWRNQSSVGVFMGPDSFSLKANHFRINTTSTPGRLYQYHIHIRPYDRNGILKDDTSHIEDYAVNIHLMLLLKSLHPEWTIGFTYDSRSTVFTTEMLALPDINAEGQPYLAEDIAIPNDDGTTSRRRYKISITSTTSCVSSGDWRRNQDPAFLRALDLGVLESIRRCTHLAEARWYLNGNTAYHSSGQQYQLAPRLIALQGYSIGFKSCLAGLTLVSDMCYTVFLNGGPIINVIAEICEYPNADSWISSIKKTGGLAPDQIAKINQYLKNTKLKTIHLGHSKKFKALGPASRDNASMFALEDGRRVTVAQYFQEKARSSPEYSAYLPNGRLKYPELPTINVGSLSKPTLVPMELVIVCSGQNFSQKCTGDVTSNLIRYAAAAPNDRFNSIKRSIESGFLNEIRLDPISAAFGVSDFEVVPMSVAGRLLPRPTLMYGNNSSVDPMLNGSWNLPASGKFMKVPPSPSADKSYRYGVIVVGRPRQGWNQTVQVFLESFQNAATVHSLLLRNGGPIVATSRQTEISHELSRMMDSGFRFVIVILCNEDYSEVKYAADSLGIITCCLRWKTVENPHRGQLPNILVKLNAKLGGSNHNISLMGNAIPPFHRRCMLVGIDVSHAAPGSNLPSVAAVVGSLDPQVTQYATHLSAQGPRVEIVAALTEAMVHLFTAFRQRNSGMMPEHVVVYRDGVGDGQFEEVLNKELQSIKDALAEMGQLTTKISLIVCQKRHKTRLVYEDSPDHYINICPGVCVDFTGGSNSITSSEYVEFYLNSHTAIQGTAKSCKYTLLYDEIGLKTAELEIMTYWLCYLYSRCNRSVSLATPAYYAHWASKRARNLLSAGANEQELKNISRTWCLPNRHSTMFFI